ncbi:MAG TPA: hypothetical protein VN901_23630 [Candidatus Acidoferrales bacterium]|nr:hypothetical protein [Candidatus Acidoferrales bacterium]
MKKLRAGILFGGRSGEQEVSLRLLPDPDHPSTVAPPFASKDHLHPNDTGYQAMADAIDLSLFR